MEFQQTPAALTPPGLPPILFNPIIATSILLAVVIAILILRQDKSNIPHANPPTWFSPTAVRQVDAMKHGMEIFYGAKKRFAGSAFRLINNNGDVVMLPQRCANIIRNEADLSFSKSVMQDFHTHLPGFQPVGLVGHQAQLMQNLVRKPLTKLLNTVTEPLASEATFAIDLVLGNSTEWKETFILDTMLDAVARLSSRVFLGDQLCRNEAWLKITKEYTIDMFRASQRLTLIPSGLKYLHTIFSQQGRTLCDQVRRAQELVNPVLEQRRIIKDQARSAGILIPKFNDAIDWAEAECKGVSYDPAGFQLFLSFAAIHTTSDLLSKIMLLLAREPALIDPLRQEMVHALQTNGWSKSSLFNMKLVDSTMKEAQRMMPSEKGSMHRIATKDIYLKEENITIRKGQYVMVDASQEDNFENPEKFDIYRWVRLRDTPEYANRAHFVSTSPEHLAFGHGMHACPGRFFAANEIKVALCYLLLNYDWELALGTTLEPLTFGLHSMINPKSTLRYRKREAEIDLNALKCE